MQPTRTRYVVLGGLCAAAALAYFTRNGVAPAESTIRTDLGISKEQSGTLISAFFWPYALCQIPAALVAQKVGARWALAAFAVLWSLATAAFAIGELHAMIAARVCMGIAQAGLVPVCIAATSRWFPRGAQGFASGAIGGFMSVGSIVAAPLTATLITVHDWRWMFVWYAVPGVVWAVWFALWYRDRPSDHPGVNSAEARLVEDSATDRSDGVSARGAPAHFLLAQPALWLICAQQFCRAAGYMFFSSWFATYLQESRGVTIATSGWLTMLPLMADFGGCISGGVLSDYVLRRTGSERLARQGVSIVALACCALLIFAAWGVQDVTLAVLVISAGMFCAALANPCASALVISLGREHAAMAGAFMNMCGNFGAAVFPMAVPLLLRHAGGWPAVIGGFGTLYVIAAAFWLPVRVKRS